MIGEPAELSEYLQEDLELCAVYGPWRRKEEILSLLTREGSGNDGSTENKKLGLKPVLVELKYVYLEEGKQCPVMISALLNAS